MDKRDRIVTRLRNLGYTHVAMDLAGFRSGSMNEGLATNDLPTTVPISSL
jgi:PP-loop superfamily ATP-utilizing enzyme